MGRESNLPAPFLSPFEFLFIFAKLSDGYFLLYPQEGIILSLRKIVDGRWSSDLDVISTLVFGCVDRGIRGWRGCLGEEMGFETAYPFLIPGGIKDLVVPKEPRDREHLLEMIGSMNQRIRCIVVMAHNGCSFFDQRTDKSSHQEMLRDATTILRDHFPRLEIIPVFVDFDGVYIVDDIAEVLAIEA